MKRAQRGAALIETALSLPVILFAMYGVSWGIRAGVVSEHAEAAVRYAGVISAQQNPYNDYSLYALYNNLGSTSNVETPLCIVPTSFFLTGGALPGSVVVPGTKGTNNITPSFWQPDAGKLDLYCDNTPERQLFQGSSRSYLLLQSVPTVNALVSDGGYFGLTLFGSSLTSKYKFYRSPDMATLMHCAQVLNTVVSASLDPHDYGTVVSKIVVLQQANFNPQPFPATSACATGIGTHAIPPTPPPYIFTPGTPAPTDTPGNGASPTPQASPNPTATAATPKPSATPTAAASPTPASSPTGGGGGGVGTPTPTPSPGAGGSPSPVGSPTGKPTSTPVTPAPSTTPSTPKPTATPTTTPTVKPSPSPSPSGPPGSISQAGAKPSLRPATA